MRCLLALVCVALLTDPAFAEENADTQLPHFPSIKTERSGIRWAPLLKQSLLFVGLQHTLRIAAESDTRAGLGGSFFRGWQRSATNLHGWADGDPFAVNYVGHPVEGSIAGFVFVQNDPRYISAEFGRNRDYWRSRLRATGWAWAYSTQFEIGPVSEATIGKVQSRFPQQGLVDHVITPTVGLGWMLAEDAIDKYLLKRLEENRDHWGLKLLARSVLNPSRSAANFMRGEYPWHRDTRGNLNFTGYLRDDSAILAITERYGTRRAYAPFELAINYGYTNLGGGRAGSISCNGGSADAIFNLASNIGMETEVGGCKMVSPEQNVSGDATWLTAGPRYTFRDFGRWTPYLHAKAGLEKLTTEMFYPDRKALVPAGLSKIEREKMHSTYTSQSELTAIALQLGGGVDYAINSALAVRVANLEYHHIYGPDFNGQPLQRNFQFTTGLVLRMGTW